VTFRLEFETTSAAFTGEPGSLEVARILRQVAAQVILPWRTDGEVRDINGNAVGKWSLVIRRVIQDAVDDDIDYDIDDDPTVMSTVSGREGIPVIGDIPLDSTPEHETTRVVDLMAALEASLAAAKQARA